MNTVGSVKPFKGFTIWRFPICGTFERFHTSHNIRPLIGASFPRFRHPERKLLESKDLREAMRSLFSFCHPFRHPERSREPALSFAEGDLREAIFFRCANTQADLPEIGAQGVVSEVQTRTQRAPDRETRSALSRLAGSVHARARETIVS